MKTVAQIIQTKQIQQVHTIEADATVLTALQVMAEHNIGALPVTEEGKVIGVISERDYARKCVLQGRSSIGTMVRELMNSPVTTVTPKQSVSECLSLITDRHLRHLPVVEDDQLVGLVSIGDLVKETIAEQEELIQQLEQYIRGEV
ncbi:CBS domain-containing protein [Halopseudomonas bauzanensis]|uniref:CBS domain-containing protein n=1 Tax=Halopseudomonas bauzanensis TaxID=653930 RepID=UPI002554D24F|nr:CBS domain-containing protein [Halopseudomonas bauzanensis]